MKSSPAPLPTLPDATPLQLVVAGVGIATAAVLVGALGMRLFGTYYLPDAWPSQYGLTEKRNIPS